MTDKQMEAAYNAMRLIWGDKLPNPEQEPRRFQFYVKMFQYCHADRWQWCLEQK